MRRLNLLAATAAFIVMLAIAVACGGNDDGSSGSATTTPQDGASTEPTPEVTPTPAFTDGCTFATPEVVGDATGVPVDSTVVISEGSARGCAYYTAAGETVIVRVEQSGLNTEDPLATDNPDYTVIPDLPYAFFRPQFNRIESVANGYSVMVTVQVEGADAQAAATAIARTVIENLPES